jgi:hypothetical protein
MLVSCLYGITILLSKQKPTAISIHMVVLTFVNQQGIGIGNHSFRQGVSDKDTDIDR